MDLYQGTKEHFFNLVVTIKLLKLCSPLFFHLSGLKAPAQQFPVQNTTELCSNYDSLSVSWNQRSKDTWDLSEIILMDILDILKTAKLKVAYTQNWCGWSFSR